MGLTGQGAPAGRARSRAGTVLIVLTAWFSTLLVATPWLPAAQAAATTPTITASPVSPGNDPTPTWTFTLPADSTSAPAPATPVAPTSPTDTATATVAVTHRGSCFVGTSAPAASAYSPCGIVFSSSAGTTTYTHTAAPLTVDGSYQLYVHDVETSTTTTTTYHADGTSTTSTAPPVVTTSADAVSTGYVYDSTGPVLVFTAKPPATGTSTTPTWTFTTGDATSVTCSFTDGTTTTAPPCTTSYTPTLTANGTYTLTVTGKDAVGNPTVISSSYTLKNAAAPGVSITPATGNGLSPTWTLTPVPGASSMDAVLTGPGTTPATVTYAGLAGNQTSLTTTLPAPTQGTWTLAVTATVSGRPSATGSATYLLDTTAPVVSVVRDTTAPVAQPRWTATVDAGATVTCTLRTGSTVVGTPGDCTNKTYTVDLTGRPGAVYTLTAAAVDAAGNTTSATDSYTVAAAAPTVTPPGPTGRDPKPIWAISAQADAVLTCTLVNPAGVSSAVTPCALPSVATPLTSDGTWRLDVVATIGTQPSATGSGSYLLDTVAPAAPSISATPAGPQSSPSITWTVTAAAGDTVRVDCVIFYTAPGATAPTSSSLPNCGATGVKLSLTKAQQGDWQAKATAYDAAGNASPVVAGPVVTYDDIAPVAPTIVAPKSPSNNASPTWTINTEPGSTLTCAWTTGTAVPVAADWFACNPMGVIAVPAPATDGTYILHARATDAALNTGPEDKKDYVLDRTAPAAPTITGPTPASPSSSAAVSWTIGTGSEVGATLECQLRKDDGTRTGVYLVVTGYDWQPCTSTFSVAALPAEGIYQLRSRMTDAAGNLGAVGAGSTYEYDKTPPQVPTVTGPAVSPSKIRDVTWTITPAATDGGTGLQCRNVDNGVADPVFTTCGLTVTRTGLADGSYALQVRAVDAAGNLSTPVVTSATYVVDNLGPAAPTFTGRAGTGNVTTASWGFQGEAGATASCRLFYNSAPRTLTPAACASGDSFALKAGDGDYQLEVRFTDAAGNPGAAALSPVYLLDTVAPAAPVVTGPAGPASTTGVSYSFTAEAGTTAQCRLNYVASLSVGSPAPVGTWTACTSPWAVTLAAGDGRYRAEVRVTDAATNVSPAALSTIYVLDTTGPAAVTFTAAPTGTANVKAVAWAWTGETPSTGTCTLSMTAVGASTATVVEGPVACDKGSYATTLKYGDGFYQLAVQLTDPTANVGAVANSAGYTLDATPPAAPSVSGPVGPGNKTSADYALTSAVEPLATAECRLTRGGTVVSDWAACTLPRTIALGADGTYVLEVRLTDQYGNLGPAGASPAYLLDTVLPTVPTVTAPASPSSSSSPTFAIGTDPDTKTTCRLTRGSVVAADTAPCAGSFTASLTGLPDGDYTLAVTATDPAGNTATGTSAAYVYDTTKPLAPAVTGPAGPSQNRNPVFSWSGEAGTAAECSLQEKAGGAGAWTTCAAPYAPTLPSDGTWVLSVRLVDAAKNVGAAGASGAYVFDTTPPVTPTVTAPTSPGRDRAPSWSAATEDGSKTECRLTGPGQLGSWAPCTLPVIAALGTDGTYIFEVRATDAAGNVSQIGRGSYVLDTSAPPAPVVTQPSGPGRSRAPAISFTSEPGTTGSCRLTRAATVLSDSAPCTSPAVIDLTGVPDGAYTLSVRAVDAAGNVGPAGTAVYVLDTTAPAPPTMTLVAGSPSADRAPAYAFNAEPGTTVTCKVTVPGGAVKDLPCTDAVSLDLSKAVDGDYVLTIRATDPAGNVGAPATITYVLDSAAPVAPRVVGPATPDSNRAPVWRIASAGPTECRLGRGTTVLRDWTTCGSSYAADLYAQPDGVYVLEARVVGTMAATSSRYRLDTAGPAAATIIGPPSPSTSRTPTWAVSSGDTGVTAQCRVLVFTGVLKDWARCDVTPAGALYALDLTGAGDGTYTLAVKLTDAAGNTGPVATSDYVLDTSAPSAVGLIAPPSPGSDTTPTWTLTSAPGVKLECRVSSGQKVISEFAPCAGTFTADLTGLPDATYTLTVHALSAAGTPGPETTSGYILDTTAAGNPGGLSGPTGPSRDRAPRWTFTLPAGTTGLCKVTMGTTVVLEGPCTSPFTLDLSNAPDGTYTVTVRAVDSAGNISSPSTIGYVLKTTAPPAPAYTMLPGSPSSTTNPTWGFSLARGTTGQCRLLQSGRPLEDWSPCTSPTTAFLSGKPDGGYTMQVRAIDAAGNTSSPATGGGDYTFDRSAAPLVQFANTPVTPGNDTSPTWVIGPPPAGTAAPPPAGTATPPPALLRTAALTGATQTECRLTTQGRGAGPWTPCSGSYVATTNGDGTYLLEVRAFDAAGGRGPASSSAYLLDTVAPGAPRFTDPLPPSVGNDPQVAWSWLDEGNLVECRLVRNGGPLAGFAECAAPLVVSLGRLGEAAYSIEIRATDAAGNTGPVSAAGYRYDVTPPAEPGFTSRPPDRGTATSVAWTFPVPVDTRAICVMSRNGTVVSEGACAGAFTLDLRGQTPATWTLSVHLVDAAGNAGPATSGSYSLLASVGSGRVDGPPGNDTGAAPSGGGAGPAAPPGRLPPDARPVTDRPGAGPTLGSVLSSAVPDVVKKGVSAVGRATAAIPGAIPGTDVPEVIKNVLGQTITKPQLPLALFVIVLLFLLVQNRIDRRDPKLAVAPVSAEPELTFGPILRPGGASA